jgi:hypothetical protein
VVVEVEVDDDGDGDGDYETVAGEIREEEERKDQQEVEAENFQEAQVVAIADNEEQDVIEQQQEETSHLQQQEQQELERLSLEPTIWDGKLKGYILAIGNVVLDTYGSLLTKQYGGRFSSWSINLIRFGSAGVIMIVISCVMRLYHQAGRKKTTVSHPVVPWYMLPTMDMISWLKICMGVLLVTFICPALSNYALFQIALAMALTLTSITPIYALLLEWLIHGSVKKPTWRSLGGATLAVGGVVILGVLSS